MVGHPCTTIAPVPKQPSGDTRRAMEEVEVTDCAAFKPDVQPFLRKAEIRVWKLPPSPRHSGSALAVENRLV